ncbi:hypothetical protein EMIT0111MI5_20280 [Burkholderia sp. IT-111MI5]
MPVRRDGTPASRDPHPSCRRDAHDAPPLLSQSLHLRGSLQRDASHGRSTARLHGSTASQSHALGTERDAR